MAKSAAPQRRGTLYPNVPSGAEASLIQGMGPAFAGPGALLMMLQRQQGIEEYNTGLEQQFNQQAQLAAKQQQQNMALEQLKLLNANKYGASSAALNMGADPNLVASMLDQEQLANMAQSYSQLGSGTNSLNEAGITPTNQLLQSIMPNVPNVPIGDPRSVRTANISANASLQAAKIRAASGEGQGTKEYDTVETILPSGAKLTKRRAPENVSNAMSPMDRMVQEVQANLEPMLPQQLEEINRTVGPTVLAELAKQGHVGAQLLGVGRAGGKRQLVYVTNNGLVRVPME